MKRILLLYHSAVGSTEHVAKMIAKGLRNESTAEIDLSSVEEWEDMGKLSSYDYYIFGYPTYHCSPSGTMMRFLERIPAQTKAKKAFIFTTRGLYAANTNRIIAKKLLSKNILTVHDTSYRTPASDGILFFPSIRFLQTFERKLTEKISSDCRQAMHLFQNKTGMRMPRFKLYSLLNAPNKFFGQRAKPRIYLHQEACIRCGKCVKHCPYDCFIKDEDGFPKHHLENCEHCYRCIHHCPVASLSLDADKTHSVLYSKTFFKTFYLFH